MAKKSTKAEKILRVNQIVRMLVNCASRSSIVQFAASEWGLSLRQTDAYIAEAREILRNDADIERHDYLAARLQTIDKVIQQGLKQNQLSAVNRCLEAAGRRSWNDEQVNRARREAAALLMEQQMAIVDRLKMAQRSGNRALAQALEAQLSDVAVMLGTNRRFPLAR